MHDAIAVLGEPLVGAHLGATEHLAQPAELIIVAGDDHQFAVSAVENLPWHTAANDDAAPAEGECPIEGAN